jgi:hypothetical protein
MAPARPGTAGVRMPCRPGTTGGMTLADPRAVWLPPVRKPPV